MKTENDPMDTAAADHRACGYCEYIWETYNADFILLPCFEPMLSRSDTLIRQIQSSSSLLKNQLFKLSRSNF
jgi:hypothetical protein